MFQIFDYFLGGGFKNFQCSSPFGEDEPILTIIFFRWVGSTTNQISLIQHCFCANDWLYISSWIALSVPNGFRSPPWDQIFQTRRLQIQESLDGHLKDVSDAVFCTLGCFFKRWALGGLEHGVHCWCCPWGRRECQGRIPEWAEVKVE